MAYEDAVREELAAYIGLLMERGPDLARPHADTLNGSRFARMKELRLTVEKHEWRIAYAFDPERKAILLCGGDKTGVNQRRFYKTLMATADERYEAHVKSLEKK